jgi:hypothetical protein
MRRVNNSLPGEAPQSAAHRARAVCRNVRFTPKAIANLPETKITGETSHASNGPYAKADIRQRGCDVRFVPKADIAGADERQESCAVKIGCKLTFIDYLRRYRELKCGTLRHVRAHPQLTPMCLNDRTADR